MLYTRNETAARVAVDSTDTGSARRYVSSVNGR